MKINVNNIHHAKYCLVSGLSYVPPVLLYLFLSRSGGVFVGSLYGDGVSPLGGAFKRPG